MSIPGFTAGASLYSTEHYRRRTTQVDSRGGNKVIVQAREGEAAANYIKQHVGGQVHCQWVEYCTGHMGGTGKDAIHCGVKEICYWWPY
jgi:hypothetical protein